MAIVAGVDFGTLSVRVSIVDSERGLLGLGRRRVSAPSQARRSRLRHAVARRPHARAWPRDARGVKQAGIAGDQMRSDRARHHRLVASFPSAKNLRAARRLLSLVRSPRQAEAARDHRSRPPRRTSKPSTGAAAFIRRSGDFRSCCTGCATIRKSAPSSLAHSSIATWSPQRLCGVTDPRKVKRSICAMGHKWLWNAIARRSSSGGISVKRRSASCRRSRKLHGRVRHFR